MGIQSRLSACLMGSITAFGVLVVVPVATPVATSMIPLARAACPPDCGGGGDNGGGQFPGQGGMQFQPPAQPPALPDYNGGSSAPPLNQSNGISIYNQSGQQASQQTPVAQEAQLQNPHPWSRAANGEQQPIGQQPPLNQELSQGFKDAQAREAAAQTLFREEPGPHIPDPWEADDRVPEPEEDQPLTYSTECVAFGNELGHERDIINAWNDALNDAISDTPKTDDLTLYNNLKAAQQAVRQRRAEWQAHGAVWVKQCEPNASPN